MDRDKDAAGRTGKAGQRPSRALEGCIAATLVGFLIIFLAVWSGHPESAGELVIGTAGFLLAAGGWVSSFLLLQRG